MSETKWPEGLMDAFLARLRGKRTRAQYLERQLLPSLPPDIQLSYFLALAQRLAAFNERSTELRRVFIAAEHIVTRSPDLRIHVETAKAYAALIQGDKKDARRHLYRADHTRCTITQRSIANRHLKLVRRALAS